MIGFMDGIITHVEYWVADHQPWKPHPGDAQSAYRQRHNRVDKLTQ
jgi:hypothetical protein